MKRLFFYSFFAGICHLARAQRLPDHVYMPNIRTVKLFQQNNQSSMPVIRLNSADLLELHFDDISAYARNYYYTIELCDADWKPADVNVFDYIKGFIQNRLSEYRISSVAATRYVHYQANLPDRNCMPAKSGNYMLKVFLDADTSKLAFTKRFMVVDQKATIAARILQPFDNELLRTHQKIQFSVGTQQLNLFSAQQQVKVVVIQNNRWDDAVKDIQPAFIRGSVLEYSGERDYLFPGGKEYRWADLQSFRFQSDRIDHINKDREPNLVYMKPDPIRNDAHYVFFSDRNGYDQINTTESVNPWWQGDYADVQFTLVPYNHQPFAGRNVYMMGELTGNQVGDTSLMKYDAASGTYTKTLFLKQGYYNYLYTTRDVKDPSGKSDPGIVEGNSWETENEYTIFFYYRPLGGRSDELVGYSVVNSHNAIR